MRRWNLKIDIILKLFPLKKAERRETHFFYQIFHI